MKNLIKNVVRSFKNNKLSIIGLVLLLFFGLGVFCLMSNTTSNIKNEYTSLASQGNLHDFTVAEMYDVGTAEYRADETKAISYTVDESGEASNFTKVDDISVDPKIAVSEFFFGTDLANQPGTYYVPLPQQEFIDEHYVRTYNITLDETLSKGLYSDYAKEHAGSGFVHFKFIVTTEWTENAELLQDALNDWEGFNNLQGLCETSVYSTDYHDFNNFVADKTSTIYSLMTTGDTPLAHMIDDNYSNEVEYRYFKSINVTATEDNIFYKIINSNKEDTIDKMVLFEDPNGRTGNYLYSASDWHPFNSQIEFVDQQGQIIEPGTPIVASEDYSFNVPADFNEVAELPLFSITDMSSWNELAQYVYSQVIQIRFKRMLVGDFSNLDDNPKEYIRAVAAINDDKETYYTNLFDDRSDVYINYGGYMYDWYNESNEIVNISANGNVVLSWSFLAPSTLTMSNWTSRMSIVNPQHLKNSSSRVIDPIMLNGFEPYKEWYFQTYDRYPSNFIEPEPAKNWFNTLTANQYSWWINPNSKSEWEEMHYDLPNNPEGITVHRGTEEGQWNGIDKQYIASCGGYNEIIWGCGLTPDFMYPVVDISRPTPNTATECLVYTNEAGYYSIKLAFVNSPVEEYVVAKFKSGVSPPWQKHILNEINKWATNATDPHMIFPVGTQVAYFASDTSNVLNCSGFRIAYIPHLVNVVESVSTILCVFIGILCAIICFVIIKRYVENNRVNIGIMRANGIKKWKIALSLFPFALLPAVIGGIAAYVVGLLFQGPMLLLFSNYWMLPTPLFGFDLVSFLVCIFAPFLIFTLICFVSTFVVLRTNTVQLMKPGSEFKTNSFSRIAKKPFRNFGILTRFRASLAFNSLTRLLILAAMSCLTMSSLVFAMTTFDKLSQSQNINSTQFDYDFSVELTTPTSSGGPYSTYDYSAPLNGSDQIKGFGWADPSQYLFNVEWNTTNMDDYEETPAWFTEEGHYSYSNLTKPYISQEFIQEYISGNEYKDAINTNGLLFLPSAADATGQKTDLLYLQNKRGSRLTLNYDIGVPGIASSNPWEIALALMPANSRNLAADSFNKLTNAAGHKVAQATKDFVEIARNKYELEVDDNGKIYYADQDQATKVHNAAREAGLWFKLGYVGDTLLDYAHWYSVYPHFFTYNESTDTYTLITDIGTVGWDLPTKFNTSFISLLTTIYQDPELLKLEYPMAYGSIPLNWDLTEEDKKDETYTYINGNIKSLSSRASYDSNHQLKIEGIKEDTNYIHLTDKNGRSLNDRLWSNNYLQSMKIDNEDTYPIIINAFVAHKYRLNVGSTININVINDVDRFIGGYKPDQHQVTFKVVGVSVGTSGEALYTRQDAANNILGLPNGDTWNRTHKYMMWSRNIGNEWTEYAGDTLPSLVDLSNAWNSGEGDQIDICHFSEGSDFVVTNPTHVHINKLSNVSIPVGFNGIYTHNKTGKPITSNLCLYSYTGMYPGSSVYKSQGSENKFTDVLKFGPNLAVANIMTGINKQEYFDACQAHLQHGTDITTEVNKFIDDVVKIYGSTTMVTAICGAIDVAATDLIYNNLISTFNLAETTIMAIIIPITIIIVAVISNLIINDSKRMAAMLKALGYSDIKNLMSILALFIPTIIIGLALAIPLSLGLTLGYQAIIFNTANILVDVTQKWWYYVAAVGGIGVILIGTYAIGYVSLKRNRLVDQIK